MSIDVYPTWTSCEVSIPDSEVICCDEEGNMMIGYIGEDASGYVAENNCEFMYNVVKWTPLPKP